MWRVAAVVATAALLAGCSSEGPASDTAPAPGHTPTRPRPTAVVTPTAEPEAARLQALAQLAEQKAGELPSESSSRATRTPADEPVLGADIGWPQCPKGLGIPERPTLGLPMPLPQAEYVVVGLTNGPGFTANPCLADQVAWIRERRLLAAAYAVVSQPSRAEVAEHSARGRSTPAPGWGRWPTRATSRP